MKEIFLSIFSFAIVGLAFAQDSTTYKADELISAYANNGHFNGAALVAAHGKILLQKGYGVKNAEENTLNDEHTQFQIASVTKQFTATVILKLAELGKMKLTDNLSKYYPGFPNGDSITIENLLTHTSGIHNFTETDSSINETDEKRMVPYLKTLKPDFKPGADWHYSNSGYVMLAYIIGKVSGMNYWQAVRTYIFKPLQMNKSGFDFTHLTGNNKAVGYDELNDTVKQKAFITDSTVPSGAGAIYSTVEDMYKWHRGLQAYKVVNKAFMDKAYTACPQHNYGYGWQIDSMFGKKMVSHSGSITGFGSNFARVTDDDICIVLLSNRGGSTFEVMNITNKLMAVLYKQPYTIPVKRTAVAVGGDVLKRYIGTYEIAELHLVIEMSLNEGRLIAQPARDGHPGPTAIMIGENDKRFYIQNDEEVETLFDVDETGKVKGITLFQNGTVRYAVKTK